MPPIPADLLRYMAYGAVAGAAVTWLEMRARPEAAGIGLVIALAGGAVGGAALVLIAAAVRKYFIGPKR